MLKKYTVAVVVISLALGFFFSSSLARPIQIPTACGWWDIICFLQGGVKMLSIETNDCNVFGIISMTNTTFINCDASQSGGIRCFSISENASTCGNFACTNRTAYTTDRKGICTAYGNTSYCWVDYGTTNCNESTTNTTTTTIQETTTTIQATTTTLQATTIPANTTTTTISNATTTTTPICVANASKQVVGNWSTCQLSIFSETGSATRTIMDSCGKNTVETTPCQVPVGFWTGLINYFKNIWRAIFGG